MIPKIIHYCWFGKTAKTNLMVRCMESWKKYAPDYEIVEWNEDNFDISKYLYAEEAYHAGKYAFVSDVVRFDVLFSKGGIYLDTDVELIKPIDVFLQDPFFMGYDRMGLLNSGLIMGSQSGNQYIKKILDFYTNAHFVLSLGRINTTTVCTIVTDILKENNININGKTSRDEKICLYPASYFDPYDFERDELHVTEDTYSIHHYASSWKSDRDIVIMKIGRSIKKVIGKKRYDKIAKLKHKMLG